MFSLSFHVRIIRAVNRAWTALEKKLIYLTNEPSLNLSLGFPIKDVEIKHTNALANKFMSMSHFVYIILGQCLLHTLCATRAIILYVYMCTCIDIYTYIDMKFDRVSL